jgi:hypothetical protein
LATQRPTGPLKPARCYRQARWSKENSIGIKLNVEVETPLSDDDRDLLAGISVMVLAIGNRRNLADQPHAQDDDELGEPTPCGSRSKDREDLVSDLDEERPVLTGLALGHVAAGSGPKARARDFGLATCQQA